VNDLSPGSGRRFDAVLFDFGGVFIDSPFALVAEAARQLGVAPELLTTVVFGSYEQDTDHPWHRLERGEMPLDACREEILAEAERHGLGRVDPLEVLARLAGGGGIVRSFVLDSVSTIRSRGLLTGIVTNNIAEFGTYWRGLMPLDELFDDVVDSSEVGVRKPDPAIFHLACERLGITPDRAVFVDDHPGNVAGAEAAGLHGLCCGFTVETTAEAVTELLALTS
jgi:epoxide hydrolase-like predicted phosphatase